MPSEDQAQADLTDESTVADPMDAADSTNSGTILAAYEAELAAAMSADEGAEEAEEQTDEFSDETDETPEGKPKDRFRFKDPVDQAVAAIAKAKGVSLVEAAKFFEGESPTKRKDLPDQETTQDAVETVVSVTAEIDELRAQKREANSALEFEIAAEIDAQIDALRDKRDDLKISEVQVKAYTEQQETAKFYADFSKNEDLTVTYYPDAAVKGSALAKRMKELDDQAKDLGDPIYHSPEKPFLLAKAAARDLGILMKKPGSAPVSKPVQNRPMQPAGGNARTSAPASATSKVDQAVASIGSEYEYDKYVGSLLMTGG